MVDRTDPRPDDGGHVVDEDDGGSASGEGPTGDEAAIATDSGLTTDNKLG